MFSILKGLYILCAAIAVFASPIAEPSKRSISSTSLPSISLDGWGGIGGLLGFDEFHGAGRFVGQRNRNQFIIVEQPVCNAAQIFIVQQQLAIIQEVTKQILLSQVCQVVAQVIVFEQFFGGLGNFRDDIRRQRGIAPGFDRNIAGQLNQLINADGSINLGRNERFNFNSGDIGKQGVVVGSDWNDQTSPDDVQLAIQIAQAAVQTSQDISD